VVDGGLVIARFRLPVLVLSGLAVLAGLIGAAAARSSDRGETVGLGEIGLDLYTVNIAGGLGLVAIGIVAVTSLLSNTAVPLWVASGLAAAIAVLGLLTWRDNTDNLLGLDGRTISLTLGLAASFAAVAWAAGRPAEGRAV
jgi:hypothetical protein